jgi:hypothetical protein
MPSAAMARNQIQHDRAEPSPDAGGAVSLCGEQHEQDHNGQRHHVRPKIVGDRIETLERAQH